MPNRVLFQYFYIHILLNQIFIKHVHIIHKHDIKAAYGLCLIIGKLSRNCEMGM